MPNHVKNRLEILSKDFDIKELVSLDEENIIYFDFNKITPMPKDLDITSDSLISLIENKFGS